MSLPFNLRMNITSRLIMLCLIMGLIPLTAAGILGVFIAVNTLEKNVTENMQSNAELQVRQITNNLDRIVKDANFLSESLSLQQFIHNGSRMLADVERDFIEFNRLHPEYYQIRYIGLDGNEVIRSNYKNKRFFLTPKDELQYKGDRYYFQKGISQNKREVYFSPIDFNVEHSEIELPLQLVVRICTPVYADDAKRGLLVINLFAEHFFNWLALPKTPFTSLLLDENGKILLIEKNGNPPALEKPVGEGQYISEVFPFFGKDELRKMMKAETFSFESVITVFHPIRGVGNFVVPTLYLVTLFPKPYLAPAVTGLKLNFLILAIFVVLLGLILGVTLARRFTRPIRQLFMEADLIAGGNFDHELKINTGDEIEDLANKFNHMRLQIKKKRGQLEEWNQTLNRKLDWHITELRNLERQLYRADKLASLGELSMRLAHEIGNPLASIKTVSQALTEDIAEGNDRLEYLDKITSEVNRLSEFLKKFNNCAVMKESEPVLCYLRELIRDVDFFLKMQAREHGITIEESYESDTGQTLVDPQQIKQVLINLILNAIQASKENGVIRISLRNTNMKCVCLIREKCFCAENGRHPGADEFVELSVCDTGQGIPEEELIRIFDPFYTTKPEGTGLGLSIVHRIVESHKGIIRVFSKEGEGTTIKIYFPKQKELAVS